MRRIVASAGMLLGLAALAHAADVAQLTGQLRSPDPEVRRTAARALGDMGEAASKAVPELTKALKDRDAFVRRFAALALGRIGPASRPAVPALVALLNDDRKEVSAAAAAALGKIGGPAVGALNEILKDKRRGAETRGMVMEILGAMGADARVAVPALIDLLNDKELRLSAVRTLEDIGPAAADAIPALTAITKKDKEDGNFKRMAGQALKKIEKK